MKNLLFPFLFLSLFFISCDKGEEVQPTIDCSGDCVFVLEDVEGETLRMNCFQMYGLKTTNEEGKTIYALPDNLPDAFKRDDKIVRFTAKFRTNQLEPNFPDPDPGINPETTFQVEIINIELKD